MLLKLCFFCLNSFYLKNNWQGKYNKWCTHNPKRFPCEVVEPPSTNSHTSCCISGALTHRFWKHLCQAYKSLYQSFINIIKILKWKKFNFRLLSKKSGQNLQNFIFLLFIWLKAVTVKRARCHNGKGFQQSVDIPQSQFCIFCLHCLMHCTTKWNFWHISQQNKYSSRNKSLSNSQNEKSGRRAEPSRAKEIKVKFFF